MAQPSTKPARPALFGGHVAVAVLALSALPGVSQMQASGWATSSTLAIAGPPAPRRMPAQRRSAPLLHDGGAA